MSDRPGSATVSPEDLMKAAVDRLLITTSGTTYNGSTLKALLAADEEIQRLRRVINKSVERRTAILLQVDRLNRVLRRHPDWLAEIRLELEYGPSNA